MPYKMKNRKEFEKKINEYLIEHPVENSKEKKLIEDFSSNELSDLYKLFLDLKGKELDEDLFKKLRIIIKENYLLDDKELLGNDDYEIKEENIRKLANIIKEKFLEYMRMEKDKVNATELSRLTVIVNKEFPEILLQFINESSESAVESNKKIMIDSILETIDKWKEHTTKEAEEENRDIIGAIYISARKLYPEMTIYVPGRIKSARSSISNIKKEANKSVKSIVPSNLERGISKEDINNQFSMKKANTDFTGFTIVLDNVDETMHFDKNAPMTNEILKLRKVQDDSITFSHEIENFLAEKEDEELSKQELMQIKLDLLMRLRMLTYEECKKEYKGISFTKLFLNNKEKYEKEALDDDEVLNDAEYEDELDEIYELIDELKKRVHDKYQAKILEVIVPEIMNDELLTQNLQVQTRFVKSVKKENGFCADYYEIKTWNGRIIELQALTKMRFRESKDGSADHSKLPNKGIDIRWFFEPALENCSEPEYEKMLNLLIDTPISKKNTLYITSDTQLSPSDKRLKRRLKAAEQSVKLKETFEDENILADGKEKEFTLEQYLIHFAEFVSPKMMSASSHHTRFHKGVAGYSQKTIVSSFREMLLKHDSTSCLAQILIDKLSEIVPNDKNEITRNGIIERSNKRYRKNPETQYSDER